MSIAFRGNVANRKCLMKTDRKVSERDLSFDIRELSRDLCPNLGFEAGERSGEPELESDPEFVADFLKSQFVEYILEGMEKKGLSKTDLARKLHKSPQYISKVINETANFTIESMAAISCALELTLEIKLHEKDDSAFTGCRVHRFDSIHRKDCLLNGNSDEALIPASVDSAQPIT